jgi:hypothetical protein
MRELSRSGRTRGVRRALARAAALTFVLGATGCADTAASDRLPASNPTDAASPRATVAVVDFSGSQTSFSVRESREYLEKLVADLGYGDRLVLLEMYRSGPRDSVGSFVQDMPTRSQPGAVTSYDRLRLEAARRGVLSALPVFFDSELVRSVPTTDILTTMHIAAEHLRDAGDRETELILLSDMLQSTSRFEFQDARRMPPNGWIGQQGSANLLPSLGGACVLVVGADHTTPDGQRVRDFWEEYFTAAGARLEAGNYRLRAPEEVVEC